MTLFLIKSLYKLVFNKNILAFVIKEGKLIAKRCKMPAVQNQKSQAKKSSIYGKLLKACKKL